MRTIIMSQGVPGRRIGLAVAFGLLLSLSGCSDDKGTTEAPAPPQAVSQPATAPTASGPPEGQTTPPAATTADAGGPCASLLTAKCSECHALARVCEKIGKKSATRWQRTVDRMIDRGAKLSPDERAAILVCLENGATNDVQGACR